MPLALVGVYLLVNARLALPLLHYRLVKSYYLARCENLARPELKCEGRCVLGRMLEAQYSAAKAEADALPVLPMTEVPPHLTPDVSTVPPVPVAALPPTPGWLCTRTGRSGPGVLTPPPKG